ncbi:MAG TPA: LysM peptidoglycan-binding domain-containing protein, partial [Bacteroidia bacterium]|nr:LysM peptidoglycan-binding domain-containing protein [Bacteroidia bacterium]
STVKKYHKVRNGESLYKIADRYNVYTSDIKRWNKLSSSKILSGQRLVIYQKVIKYVPVVETDDQTDEPNQAVNEQKKEENLDDVRIESKSNNSLRNNIVTYTVQRGDTLWSIARKYEGITVEEIKKQNKIFDSRSLKPGTKLKIEIKG